ncbi:betaine/proline/choline family ABC transporter ATP-binding protein [Nocardiopsis composta]|uniref:ABC-type quaternary amine transporter n=1 Tax=Nocardiopsis composta TaxID=157465 RepID=A0A7W8VES0_9ACTN|nr:osmoprotectant transport system ATP-binding protein [Nocardiopsis composta]
MTDASATASPDAMIRLENLTKAYPGQAEPAIDGLSLEIPRGEIVVFVGPSGCGKTTLMKLINRLIEPTSGRIVIDGRDVTEMNPDELRRGIGYAIQQTGLFPHRTVAQNIATVPKLLGWPAEKVSARVDELLTMVGLAPDTYRDRYPKQLSGGQQQRVGVARALAADPAVMLMDEPFGAIDPITREALQNEFLRIQRDIRKTIVFVTHDIDEAVKLGDRIAVFGPGGRIAQYDTPEAVLSDPADDYVAEFIGAGAYVKRLTLTRLSRVEAATDWPTVPSSAGREARLAALRSADRDFVLVLDDERRPAGWLGRDLAADDDRLTGDGLPLLSSLGPDDTLFDALNAMLASNADVVVVTGEDGRYRGTLGMAAIQELIHTASPSSGAGAASPAAGAERSAGRDRGGPDSPGKDSPGKEVR